MSRTIAAVAMPYANVKEPGGKVKRNSRRLLRRTIKVKVKAPKRDRREM